MTRQTKAAILSAVRDGRLKPSDLLEPVNYLVYHKADAYHWQGGTIAPDRYHELLAKYKAETERRDGNGLPVGYFITIEYISAPFAVAGKIGMSLPVIGY
jgi:hypothetical protein